MLDPIFYCNFHSGCIIRCIDIPYAYIQKISFFAYFGVYVRLKSVRIWEFPGLNFWAPSWKWFLKDISFRKQHQKSSIYKCTNRPFLCISCLTLIFGFLTYPSVGLTFVIYPSFDNFPIRDNSVENKTISWYLVIQHYKEY